MAKRDLKAVPVLSPNPDAHQQQLLSLISTLITPPRNDPNSEARRLLVDSRVFWALEPIDASMTWMYLPQNMHARNLAGCLMITAD